MEDSAQANTNAKPGKSKVQFKDLDKDDDGDDKEGGGKDGSDQKDEKDKEKDNTVHSYEVRSCA